MRKVLLASVVLALIAFLAVGCGDSSKKITPPPAQPSQSFAFLQEATPAVPYILNPALGKLTGTTLATTIPTDSGTGQPVKGDFWSIALNKEGTKATFDLYGGVDGTGTQYDVYTANVDGSGMVQLTHDYEAMLPSFSSDGTKIVFTSWRPYDGSPYNVDQVAVINADGTGEQILPLPPGAEDTWAPSFSPDGTKIAVEAWGYTADAGEFDGIFVMNADGSNPVMLTNPWAICNCWDEYPVFTLDGTKVVFSRDDFSGEVWIEDIYIANVDGSGVTKLTDGKGINADPLVLSDGRILFSSNRDNLSAPGGTGYELYVMNQDGTGLTRLTSDSIYQGTSQEMYEITGSSSAYSHASNHRMKKSQR
jgi:Tol biopolymer transport system component